MVDWKSYDKSKEKELLKYLREAKEPVGLMDEPWQRHVMGRPPYDSRTLVVIRLLKEYMGLPYRDVESLLRSSYSLKREIGLTKVPDFKTVQRTMERMSESWKWRGFPENCAEERTSRERGTSECFWCARRHPYHRASAALKR